MPKKKLSLLLTLKDLMSKGINKIKNNVGKATAFMKGAFSSLKDSIKGSMLSSIAVGNLLAGALQKGFATIGKAISDSKQAYQDFQETLTAVYTLLDQDTFDKHAKQLEKGSIKIMQEYNLEIQDVNKSLFDAVSAGIAAGDATEFLGIAAKLAKGGVTDLSVAVNGMTSVMNAFGLEASEATNVADAFFTAQKFGKTTVEQLSNSIGKVAPIAKSAGVSYQELLAAMSQLTLSGISTDEAVTALKGTITAVIKPTDDAQAKFTELGISTGGAAFANGKFIETLQKVAVASKGNIDTMAELIPNVRGLLAVTSLATDEGLAGYSDILQAVAEDHESLDNAAKKQLAVLKEQIATQKGEFLPTMLAVGKAFSMVELFILKTMNAIRKAKGPWLAFTEQLNKVLGITKLFSKEANKLAKDQEANAKQAVDTELSKNEQILANRKKLIQQEQDILAKQQAHEKQLAKEKKAREDEARAIEKAEKEAAAKKKKEELEAEAAAELEAKQTLLANKAEMDILAEEARRDFETEKKEFDRLSAEEKIELLRKTLGRERVAKAAERMQELAADSEHLKALEVQKDLHEKLFQKLNADKLKKIKEDLDQTVLFEDSKYKELSQLLTGYTNFEKLNAEQKLSVTRQAASITSDLISNVMSVAQEAGGENFLIFKRLAQAQALINTYQSATAAFTSLASIPIVGPALGGIAAAAAIASGLAQVRKIENTNVQGAEMGGLIKRNTMIEVGEGNKQEAVIPLEGEGLQRLQSALGLSGEKTIVLQMDNETIQTWLIKSEEQRAQLKQEDVI